jgi:photosynthetic reaction center H subunit
MLAFGQITEHIDLALVSLYIFWAFFFWLVLYLQQEGRREGFPLVSDPDGKSWDQSLWMPKPKTFITNDGRTKQAPDPAMADTRELNAEFAIGGPGSPLVPLGDPMKDSIGPASYAERPDIPDLTFEGEPRILPMRVATDFSVAEQDIDPRGLTVFGADGKAAGTVVDIWVDKSDYIIRYLEVELPGTTQTAAEGEQAVTVPGRRVLLPFNVAQIKTDRDLLLDFIRAKKGKPNAEIHTAALLASQIAEVPATADADRITMLEEEKIQAHYGGGYLYATPDRQEPII